MNIKISNYALDNHYNNPEIVPGMRVCPRNQVTSIGVIVDISPELVPTYWNSPVNRPKSVTVVWATGPRKGKTIVQTPDTLSNFDLYFARVQSEFGKLEKMKESTLKFGM